jgi:hypothetical protein
MPAEATSQMKALALLLLMTTPAFAERVVVCNDPPAGGLPEGGVIEFTKEWYERGCRFVKVSTNLSREEVGPIPKEFQGVWCGHSFTPPSGPTVYKRPPRSGVCGRRSYRDIGVMNVHYRSFVTEESTCGLMTFKRIGRQTYELGVICKSDKPGDDDPPDYDDTWRYELTWRLKGGKLHGLWCGPDKCGE